jgi:hypothetical protein
MRHAPSAQSAASDRWPSGEQRRIFVPSQTPSAGVLPDGIGAPASPLPEGNVRLAHASSTHWASGNLPVAFARQPSPDTPPVLQDFTGPQVASALHSCTPSTPEQRFSPGTHAALHPTFAGSHVAGPVQSTRTQAVVPSARKAHSLKAAAVETDASVGSPHTR